MAVLRFNRYGGILPSVQKRRLPDDAAEVAHNLDLRFGDFRPLSGPGESVHTVTTTTKSLFRTPSGVWLSSINDVNYVNAQVSDAEDERVYLTGRAAYPEAWENGGALETDGTYRQLGVPRPSDAPTVVLDPTDEFTVDEAAAERARISGEIATAATANQDEVLLGNEPPADGPGGSPSLDLLYDQVTLHIRAEGPAGSRVFVDSSRVARPISSLGNAEVTTTSPIQGAGSIQFNGGQGLSFPNRRVERGRSWTVDIRGRSPFAITAFNIAGRGGYFTYLNANQPTNPNNGGVARIATYLERDVSDSVRVSGGSVAADTNFVLSFQCDGSVMTAFLDGTAIGSDIGDWGLDLNALGWDRDPGGADIILDDIRITEDAARYAGTHTPETEYPTGSYSEGIWLAHGTATTPALPTSGAQEWAYLVAMLEVSGQYVFADPRNEYLAGPVFRGVQVTYLSAVYWAVPVLYQGRGFTIDRVALSDSLELILGPDAAPLFDPAEADDIADAIGDRYDPTIEPSLSRVNDLISAQNALLQALSVESQSAGTTSALIQSLESAARLATNYYAGLNDSAQTFILSLYDTLVAPLLPTPVTRIIESRAYVVTYVTDWREESAPSAPSDVLDADDNDAVDVTAVAPPSGRNVVGWRLWRSSSTNSGAEFQLVADKDAANAVLDADGNFDYFDIATLTYSDALSQNELQETLQTLTWVEPPAGLKGLVGMPNGIMAGFVGKLLCFSEPFAPYAWPEEYQIPIEFNIVGLGVFGQTLVVLTEGNPYYASGADSASMSAQKIESTQACASKRSIASMEGGVAYASPDGLCLAGPNGVQIVTDGAFDKDDWQALGITESFGGFHEGVYYLFTPDA